MPPHKPQVDLELAMEVAHRAVQAAGQAAMRLFRTGFSIETKPDRSPVTAADREAEAAVIEVIRSTFPEHAILGEETGEHPGNAPGRWIIDPIDGTRGFTRGGSLWGPLVALEMNDEIVAGAMALPVHGNCYFAALGQGAYRNGERIRLSGVSTWSEATLSLGELQNLLAEPILGRVTRLVQSAATTRCEGDLASCAMLLDGRADAWLEAGVRLWDIAPLKILVEEAGGRFTTFDGSSRASGESAVATNGLLHDHVLEVLRDE